MNKRRMMAGVLAVLGAVAFVAQVPLTPAAAALPGLVRTSADSASNGAPIKNATAQCPAFMVVVGGGARVSGIGSSQMRLTRLMPVLDESRGLSYFAVTAESPTGTPTVNPWIVTAYAVCAFRPSGYQIVVTNGASNTQPFKQAIAGCPGGKRVIGTGAGMFAPSFSVGLQLNRADGALGIARATARSDADFTGSWTPQSRAICIDPIGALVSNGGGSQTAGASCPAGTRVHGAGGGGALTDQGPVFLRVIEPNAALTRVDVAMTGPYPGGMMAQAICD